MYWDNTEFRLAAQETTGGEKLINNGVRMLAFQPNQSMTHQMNKCKQARMFTERYKE